MRRMRSSTDAAGVFQNLTQQRERFFGDWTIGPDVVWRVVEHRRDFCFLNEAEDINRARRFDLDLGDLFGLDDRVTIRLVLIAFGDLIVRDDLPALLAALVVTDWTKIVAVQLIELNSLRRFQRVVDANRNRDEQKSNVAFPNRTHRGSSVGYAKDTNAGDVPAFFWAWRSPALN